MLLAFAASLIVYRATLASTTTTPAPRPLPTLRIALVGLRERHLKHTIAMYLKLQHSNAATRGFHIAIVAVVSQDLSDRNRASKLLQSNPTQYTTLKECLDDPTVDIVDLDMLELDAALAHSFAANKAVLMPGSTLLQESHLLSSISLCVVEPWAYKPGVHKVAKLLDSGIIGTCVCSYTLTVEQQMLETGVHLCRATRLLFGEITTVCGADTLNCT